MDKVFAFAARQNSKYFYFAAWHSLQSTTKMKQSFFFFRVHQTWEIEYIISPSVHFLKTKTLFPTSTIISSLLFHSFHLDISIIWLKMQNGFTRAAHKINCRWSIRRLELNRMYTLYHYTTRQSKLKSSCYSQQSFRTKIGC